MRVVFDSYQSYIMDSMAHHVLNNSIHNPDQPGQPPLPAPPLPADSHPDPAADPQPSQNNLDVLLTAIGAHPASAEPSLSMASTSSDIALNAKIQNSNTPMSIQSLLAGSEHNGQHPQVWNSPDPPQSSFLASQGKRKHEGPDGRDVQAKIRRIVRDHLVMDHARILTMTTVVCLHAAVAQKSYGSEKRFLCPPPIVRIEGPSQHMASQQLSMCIVSEDGVRATPLKGVLDSNMQASFKHLHVAGTAKQKNFFLALDIATPPSSAPGEGETVPGKIWASFESAPVTIISKPSKKTAKTRNIGSCILPGGPVSLFNRINSQTVRTKYMTIDHGSLCASNASWSAFNVNVIHRPPEPPHTLSGPQPVSYGSQIVLTDTLTGISTSALIIRKVDKSRVSLDDGGPVSQMQKIALQRCNVDGTRQYLSAAGPLTIGGVVSQTIGPPTTGGIHTLMFQSARTREEVKDGQHMTIDEVDDYLCWTIVGISKFQYTFFDALGKDTITPSIPLTPFPTLFTPPVYRPNTNTLELTVSNFYSTTSEGKNLLPLEVWLGPIGPLNQRVFQATLPGPLTSVSNFGHSNQSQTQGRTPSTPTAGSSDTLAEHSGNATGMPTSPTSSQHTQQDREPQTPSTPQPMSPQSPRPSSALGPLHSIVVLDMPSIEVIVRAIQETMDNSISHFPSELPEPQSPDKGGDPKDQNVRPANNHPPPTASPRESQPRSAPQRSPTLPAHSQNSEQQHRPQQISRHQSSSQPSVNGRSLPLLFIRPSDGMGYHSGRSIVCENLIHNLTMNALSNAPGPNMDAGWIAAAQAAASSTDSGYAAAWSLRVV